MSDANTLVLSLLIDRQREIESLRAEVARLSEENAALAETLNGTRVGAVDHSA